MKKKDASSINGVPLYSRGKGLPYAPENWPNPGDTWRWWVGGRVNRAGFFQNRFLYLPERLKKQRFRSGFGSKSAVANYIRTRFPEADLHAFFAAFHWEVPAVDGCETGAKHIAHSRKRMREPKTAITKSCGVSATHIECSRKRLRRAATNAFFRGSTRLKSSGAGPSKLAREGCLLNLSSSEEEELEESYSTNLIGGPVPTQSSGAASPHMASIAGKGFDGEVGGENDENIDADYEKYVKRAQGNRADLKPSSEVTDNETPPLESHESIRLNLLEEVDALLHKEMVEAEKFLTSFQAKEMQLSNLENELEELEKKGLELQLTVDLTMLDVQKVDDMISRLQSRRAKLYSIIESNTIKKEQVMTKTDVMTSLISKARGDIVIAKSEIPKWEQKRKQAADAKAGLLSISAFLKELSADKTKKK